MKNRVGLAVIACALVISMWGTAQATTVVDRIVAVVNGEIITYQELVQQIRLSTGQEPDQAMLAKIGPDALQAMIDSLILKQEAARLKVEVTDAEVDGEIRQFKARRQMNDDDFVRGLRLQGLTPEQFRQRTREDIVKRQMLGYMVRRKVVVTQEEVDAYIAKNHAELTAETHLALQIVVVPDAERAAAVHRELASDKVKFDDAVRKYSIGPKEDNGVMRDVRLKDLDTPWRTALRDMKTGDVSAPFQVTDKWVVAKIVDSSAGPKQELAAVQDEAREALMRPKLEERFKEYMNGLRTKAVVEKRL